MDERREIPERLRADLKALLPRGRVPARVDAAVHAAAEAALRNRPRRYVAVWAAVAAVLVIVLGGLGLMLLSPKHGQPLAQAPARVVGDVNGDGKVDILDALALSRQLQGRQSVPAPWDTRHELTKADVSRIAQLAVQLEPERDGRAAARQMPPVLTMTDLGEVRP